MLLDARQVTDGSRIEADVCIVGGGPAGITLARELAGPRRRVALLESGGLAVDPATDDSSQGGSTGRAYFPLGSTRSRVLGGTTEVWAGECRPLDPADFAAHLWVPDSGWPFGFEELAPFYERARPLLELGPLPFDAADWSALGIPALALADGRLRTAAFHYSAPTHFGRRHCAELEASSYLDVYLGATVVELETTGTADRVSAVVVRTQARTSYRVVAGTVVLTAGGIENPRLLLSSDGVERAGLGNRHDLVGRYFMEHLYLDDAARLRVPRGALGEFYRASHAVGRDRLRAVLALAPEVWRRESLTNVCAVVTPLQTHGTAGPAGAALGHDRRSSPGRDRVVRAGQLARRVAGWVAHRVGGAAGARAIDMARDGGDRLRAPLGETLGVKQVMEQAPDPRSRVVLTGERDLLDCRRVELRWMLSALDRSSAVRAHEIFEEGLAVSGVSFTSRLGGPDDPWPERLRGARHHMGTTRMHVDPRRGVVDADGRVHGIANLYVAGSSVFPTGGAANPTFTIVALALRLADHLRAASIS